MICQRSNQLTERPHEIVINTKVNDFFLKGGGAFAFLK